MDVLSQGRPRVRTSTRNNSGQIIRTGTSFCQAQSVNLAQLEVKSTNYCNGLVCFAQVLVFQSSDWTCRWKPKSGHFHSEKRRLKRWSFLYRFRFSSPQTSPSLLHSTSEHEATQKIFGSGQMDRVLVRSLISLWMNIRMCGCSRRPRPLNCNHAHSKWHQIRPKKCIDTKNDFLQPFLATPAGRTTQCRFLVLPRWRPS